MAYRPRHQTETAASETGCKLIVHADDLGLSEGVNNGIVTAHREGIVTSASLMACGPAFDHAVALAHATPSLDIGVHLTLVEELPLSDPEAIPTLIDKTGHLQRHAKNFLQRYLLGKISLTEIRRELETQLQKALDTGLPISHLDSHQHLHVIPGIWRVVLDLGREHGIACVRYPREQILPYMFADRARWGRLAQLLVLNAFCASAKRETIATPEYFFGFFYGGELHLKHLTALIPNFPARGYVELMCHPGHTDNDATYQHWGYNWQQELDALTAEDVKVLLAKRTIDLVSYRDLTP